MNKFEPSKAMNPAFNYISLPQEQIVNQPNSSDTITPLPVVEKKHESIDMIPAQETKSKHVHLMIYPNIDSDLRRIAEMKGLSFNSLVNNIFTEYASTNESLRLIDTHKKLKG
jgi:hypothetical protein